MNKERKSLSLIFNRELQVGEPVIYNQIISTLLNLGITEIDDLDRITPDDISEMVRNIYKKNPDCYSSMPIHANLFSFIREYRAKIMRDLELFRRGEQVKFRVRLRPRYNCSYV
ncbi:uncharacterized protein LOC141528654 [Cotesia typhae]|uniref:uncharacterized protein LOC141528654 n=1 Tax=Cotesia typhae TaxID=2053667 RepID=UPI003D69229D